MRINGTVKWFDDVKGIGFITRATGGDIFVHHSAIQNGDGRRTLTEGQFVEFDEERNDKGPRAEQVVATETPVAENDPQDLAGALKELVTQWMRVTGKTERHSVAEFLQWSKSAG